MSQSWLNDELRLLADQVARFIRAELEPRAEQWRQDGCVDRDTWRKAGEAGLLCASIPETYGGGGGTRAHEAVIHQELSRAGMGGSFGTANSVSSALVAHYILAYGTEEQKRRWLPMMARGELVGAIAMTEPGAGSDLQAVRTSATKVDNGWRVNGQKTFISNGQTADLIAVVARTSAQPGGKGLSMLMLETDGAAGFSRGRKLEKIGMPAQDTSELSFDDVFIPDDNLLGAEAALVAAPAMAQTAAQAPATAPQSVKDSGPAAGALSDDTRDEIIVTASKREERLQDVPASITAISGDTLARIGAQGFRDYASLTPGLSLRDLGNPGMGTIILRGLNTGPQQISNTAATYIDDAPFSASGFLSAGTFITPDPDIADLDRVEVLKGPQGTLYGANSLGGLVRIVSRRPQLDDVSGMATAEGTTIDGGGQGYAFRGALNLPIVRDQLAIRINGVYRRAPGWTDNVFTGTNNVNDTIIKGGRVAIRWRPSDALTLDLNGIVQDIDNKGYAQEDDVTDTLTPRYGRNKYGNSFDFGSVLKYRLASGTATYDFGPVSLVGTASYTKYSTLITADVTETYISYLRAASPALAAIIPATAIGAADNSPNMKKFSTEVRLVSKRLGPVEFVAGGFYTNEKNLYRTIITVNTAAGVPLTAPFDLLFVANTISNYEEEAAFGNLTFYLSDKLDITGGIRYAHNSQFAQTGGPGAVSFYAPRETGNFTFKENVATYLATIRWRPTSNISFYARAADGYRPGGPQNNPAPPPDAQITIRPDTVWNYEAGVKASFGKLSANASIYHIDWKDIQINTLLNGITLQANGGKAKVDGFEVELAARPTPLTTISANAGYTNARISRIDPGVRASIGANPGDKLPLTPDWTVAILGDQQIPFGDTVRGNIGATLRFRSDMPSSYSGSLLNPNIKIPDLTTLDLRAGVSFPAFTVQLRAENVLNAHGYLSVASNKIVPTQGVPTQAIVNRPRSFTLSLGARF